MATVAPLRDYTETELLALPADSRLLFADNVHNGLITYDPYTNTSRYPRRKRRILQPRGAVSAQHLQSALSRVRALRCISHGISSFSLYPTNEQEYNVTKFLWRAANNLTFEAREAAALFQRNVFIISMSASLFDFLTAVSWDQVEQSLIYILTCLADGHEGMEVLKEDLAAPLVAKIDQFANVDDPAMLVNPQAFRLFVDVIMDGIAWMGPWVVPTTLCYLSASDMTQLLSNRFDRDIFSAPEKFELVQSMMWNIYRDWQTYHHVLVRNGDWPRRDALQVMASMIRKKGQASVDEVMHTVLQLCLECDQTTLSCLDIHYSVDRVRAAVLCATEKPQPVRRKKSLFSSLPSDVVLNKIFPKLFQVYVKDLRERIRSDLSTGARQTSEPPSPVTVLFSLKSWVLENFKLQSFYRSCNPGTDREELRDPESRDDVFVEVEVFEEEEPDGIVSGGSEQFDGEKYSEDDDDDDDNMVEIAQPIADAHDDGADSMAVEEAISSDLELDRDLDNVEAVAVEYAAGDVRDVDVIDADSQLARRDAH